MPVPSFETHLGTRRLFLPPLALLRPRQDALDAAGGRGRITRSELLARGKTLESLLADAPVAVAAALEHCCVQLRDVVEANRTCAAVNHGLDILLKEESFECTRWYYTLAGCATAAPGRNDCRTGFARATVDASAILSLVTRKKRNNQTHPDLPPT